MTARATRRRSRRRRARVATAYAVGRRRRTVDPERAGWELGWWIGADDRWHLPEEEVAVRQHARSTACPVVRPSMRVPGGDAVQRVVRGPTPDAAVVEIVNESPAPFVAAARGAGRHRRRPRRHDRFADGRSAVRTARPPTLGDDGRRHDRGRRDERAGVRGPLLRRARDRGARLAAALLYPVRAPHDAARGRGARHPRRRRSGPGCAAGRRVRRGRGGRHSSLAGCGSSCPTSPWRAAVQTTRAATVLAGQAWKVDPMVVVAVLEDWGLDPEAAAAWTRLTGRERRRIGRRTPPADPPVGRGAVAPGCPDAAVLDAVRTVVVRETDDTVELLGDWPRDWIGWPIDVRTRRPDAVRCRTRCGGTATDRRCSGRPPDGARASPRPGSIRDVVDERVRAGRRCSRSPRDARDRQAPVLRTVRTCHGRSGADPANASSGAPVRSTTSPASGTPSRVASMTSVGAGDRLTTRTTSAPGVVALQRRDLRTVDPERVPGRRERRRRARRHRAPARAGAGTRRRRPASSASASRRGAGGPRTRARGAAGAVDPRAGRGARRGSGATPARRARGSRWRGAA